jgi:hypothetical protein
MLCLLEILHLIICSFRQRQEISFDRLEFPKQSQQFHAQQHLNVPQPSSSVPGHVDGGTKTNRWGNKFIPSHLNFGQRSNLRTTYPLSMTQPDLLPMSSQYTFKGSMSSPH